MTRNAKSWTSLITRRVNLLLKTGQHLWCRKRGKECDFYQS